MMSRKRRRYTMEFKIESVKLITEAGYSIAEAARSLGIHANLLGKWKQQFETAGTDGFPGKGKQTEVDEELRRLREENRRLRMGRDLLKKATVYFAFASQ